MKRFYKVSGVVFFFLMSFAFINSQGQALKSEKTVTLRGMITEYGDEALYNATVFVYDDTTLFTSTASGHDGRCKLQLPLDKEFTLVFSKEGFVSKRIVINTFVPGSVKDSYKFSFKMNLFEEIKGVDTSILNEPLARVAYNLPKRAFEYNEDHTAAINEKIEELYKNYFDSMAAQASEK